MESKQSRGTVVDYLVALLMLLFVLANNVAIRTCYRYRYVYRIWAASLAGWVGPMFLPHKVM